MVKHHTFPLFLSPSLRTRPSALGMLDTVMKFLEILGTQEFPRIHKLFNGTKVTKGMQGTNGANSAKGDEGVEGHKLLSC